MYYVLSVCTVSGLKVMAHLTVLQLVLVSMNTSARHSTQKLKEISPLLFLLCRVSSREATGVISLVSYMTRQSE